MMPERQQHRAKIITMATFVSVVQFCRSELFRVPHTFTAVTTAIIATPTAVERQRRHGNYFRQVARERVRQRSNGAAGNDQQ